MQRDRVTEPLAADYNVAPTKPIYAVLTRGASGAGSDGSGARPGDGHAQPAAEHPAAEHPAAEHPAAEHPAAEHPAAEHPAAEHPAAEQPGDPQRELRVLRWGLVPFWAKDPSIGSRLINARAETVDSKPAFRRAFARRRCLLPADGYYEWQRPEGGARGPKQPYYISRRDGGPLAFAGLYELWRDRGLPDDHERAWLWTATIITTSAPDDLGRIHDRMPMVIEPDRWEQWLDPACDNPAGLRALLAPAASGGLRSYPVSTAVNSVRNNGPRLIERVDPGQQPGAGPARPGGSPDGAAGRAGSAANRLS